MDESLHEPELTDEHGPLAAIANRDSVLRCPLANPDEDVLLGKVAVDETHDAFGVSDQLTDTPDIQLRVVALKSMDFDR